MKWYEIMAANDLLDNTTARVGLDCVCVCVCAHCIAYEVHSLIFIL